MGMVFSGSLSLVGTGQKGRVCLVTLLPSPMIGRGGGQNGWASCKVSPGSHCRCSLGTLWRNVWAGTSPSPRPGKMGKRWGPHTEHRQKVLQNPPLSGVQVPTLRAALHQPQRVTSQLGSPLPTGGQGRRCPDRDGYLISVHVPLPAP